MDVADCILGKGCYVAIQRHMRRHLKDNGEAIFHKAAKSVKRNIEELCDHLEKSLKATTDKMMDKITEDYINVFVGQDDKENSVAMQAARGEVSFILGRMDDRIQHALRAHAGASLDETSAAIKTEVEPEPVQESASIELSQH